MDGLHSHTRNEWDHRSKLIEAHGRLGLYKCIPENDSDTDSDSDDDEERKVQLGHRRKVRQLRSAYQRSLLSKGEAGCDRDNRRPAPCRYELEESIPVHTLEPESVRMVLMGIKISDDQSITGERESDGVRNKVLGRGVSLQDEFFPEAGGSGSEAERNAEQLVTSPSGKSSSDGTSEGEVSRSQGLNQQSCGLDLRNKGINDGLTPEDGLSVEKKCKARERGIQILSAPLCPGCGRPAPPQALLFDEGYHSHDHYKFRQMEGWIESADVLVFVGTSFQVTITDVALMYARDYRVPCFNFNVDPKGGFLESTSRLNAENILGDVSETLPQLWQVVKKMLGEDGCIDEQT